MLATLWIASALLSAAQAAPVHLVRHTVNDLTRRNSISSKGRTVEMNGTHYYVPGKPAGTFSVDNAPSDWYNTFLFPLAVVSSSEKILGKDELSAVTSKYMEEDDVLTEAFLDNIIARYTGDRTDVCFDASLGSDSVYIGSGYNTDKVEGSLKASVDLPPGPYFASISNTIVSLFEAWRLYEDVDRAFFYGTVPGENGAYEYLPSLLPGSNGVAAIGTPSRLYYPKSVDKPLNGVRVAVKDLYDIKGLKTSMGNRAWLHTYPVAETTAVSIQHLIDLGAVIVGKTRCSQFANGEYGTADNVDYGVPFNPRADGYQDPSSSSSGAGAAGSSYGAWLDLNVGSDTGGSVRAPAGVNGNFGNRPSQGAIDLKGVLPLSPEMDTSAIIAANAYKFADYAKHYYSYNNTFKSYPSFPGKLLYPVDPAASLNTSSPGFFPPTNEPAVSIYENFVAALEGFLGVRRTEYDFYEAHHAALGEYPPEYIGPAWSLLTSYEQWELVGKPFTADYQALNNGDLPFVDPPVTVNWEYGASLSEANRTEYLERKQAFVDWLGRDILVKNSTESCSNALQVFPLTQGTPSYKSDYHLASTIFNGWNRYSISQLGQVPEVVLPIGQVPYQSEITNTTKYLPVSISIQAAAGCDFVLYDLLVALADAGIVQEQVLTGTELTFPM